MEITAYRTSQKLLSVTAEKLLKKFDTAIVNGELEKWFSGQCKSVTECVSFDDYEKGDHHLFTQYMSLRASALEIVLYGKPRKSTDFNFEDHAIFDYLNSPSYQKDLRDFEQFQAKRREDWNASVEKPPEAIVDPKSEVPLKSEPPLAEQNAPPSQAENNTPANRLENILRDAELSREPGSKQGSRKKANIPVLPFPPFKLLQDAYNKKQEEHDLILAAHNLAIDNLHQAEAEVVEAEKGVRIFDEKKEQYLYSGTRMPPELFDELKKANEAVVEAGKRRREAAQLFYDIRSKAFERLVDEQIKPEKICPRGLDLGKKKYSKMSPKEATSLQEKLDKALLDKYCEVKRLLGVIERNVTDFQSMEAVVAMIARNQFEGIEKLLPKKLEDFVGGEIGKIKISKLIDAIIKINNDVVELSSTFGKLSPEDQIKYSREHLDDLGVKIEKKEGQLEVYKKQLHARKSVIMEMDAQISSLRVEEIYSEARIYRAIVENIDCEKQDKKTLTQRVKFLEKLDETMKKEGTSSPEAGCNAMLDLSYAKVRGIGKRVPSASISGVPHETFNVEIDASESRDGIVAQAQGSWQYRVPEKLMGADFSEHRYSCRLVANKDMIDTLDELAKKFNFQYKVPLKNKLWDRYDTVTIYCKEKLSTMDEQELAKVIQPFVFEGNDEDLLGRAVSDDGGKPYQGIRADESPKLLDIIDEIETAYKIDERFGNTVSEYFKIAGAQIGVTFRASPGMVTGFKRLLDEIK